MMLDFECKSLQKVPLFKDIDARSLQLIAFAAERVTFQPGEAIFERGDTGDAVYIIVTGEVDLIVHVQDDEPVVLAHFGPGRSFGEISVLTDADRTVTVKASTPTMLLQISKTDFLELTREVPQFAMAVMRDLAGRLRDMVEKYAEHPAM